MITRVGGEIMIDRRSFLKAVTMGAVGGVCMTDLGRAHGRLAKNKLGKIGLQLYTVRNEMQKDFEGTLKQVAEIGYREVEFAGYFNRPPQKVKAILDHNGLSA